MRFIGNASFETERVIIVGHSMIVSLTSEEMPSAIEGV
jgi:hypothetical protein